MGNLTIDEFKRLKDSMEWSREQMEWARKNYADSMWQYVGTGYGAPPDDLKHLPMNAVRMFTNIVTRVSCARNPEASVETEHRNLNYTAERLRLALNVLAKRQNVKHVLRRICQAGILGHGVGKVGLTQTRQIEADGRVMWMTEPKLWHVSPDDLVCDMDASSWDEQEYVGHRVSKPVDEVQQSYGITDDEVRRWTDDADSTKNEDGESKVTQMSKKDGGYDDRRQFRRQISLWQVWVRKSGTVVTWALNGGDKARVLRERPYYGPDTGPMNQVRFSEVVGQVLALPPVTMIRPLHDAINHCYRKAIYQSERQKTVYGVRPGARKDAEKIAKTADGYFVGLDSPNSVAKIEFPGVSRENLAFVIDAMSRLNWASGNMDVLAGLASGADTYGQEQILATGASRVIEDLTDAMWEFSNWYLRAMAMYLWEDPLIELPLSHRIPGTEYDIRSVWNAEQKRGEYIDYNIGIEMTSMNPQNKTAKFNTLVMFMNQILIPLMGQMQSAGIVMDVEHVAKLAAKLLGIRELDEILIFNEAESGEGPMTVGESTRMPAATTRTYVRENKPTRTRMGTDAAMVQQLMGGGKPNPAAEAPGLLTQ